MTPPLRKRRASRPPEHPLRSLLRFLLLLDGLCVLVAGVALLLFVAILFMEFTTRVNSHTVPAMLVLGAICATGVLALFCRTWLDDPPHGLLREVALIGACGSGGVPLGLIAAYLAPSALELPWLAEVWRDGSDNLSGTKLVLACLCGSCGVHALCALGVRAWRRSEPN